MLPNQDLNQKYKNLITVSYGSCVSTVKDWSTDRWKSMWNRRKNCLTMKESVSWTSSRLTIRLLNLKRPQLNSVVQVLAGHCNLQRHKKTTGCAESSLCPKCSLKDETPNHHVGNCKLYQDIRVKYFGITKTTVHNVVTKCNINKLATYLKEANNNIAATVAMRPTQCVGGLYLTVADSLAPLPNDNSNNNVMQITTQLQIRVSQKK